MASKKYATMVKGLTDIASELEGLITREKTAIKNTNRRISLEEIKRADSEREIASATGTAKSIKALLGK